MSEKPAFLRMRLRLIFDVRHKKHLTMLNHPDLAGRLAYVVLAPASRASLADFPHRLRPEESGAASPKLSQYHLHRWFKKSNAIGFPSGTFGSIRCFRLAHFGRSAEEKRGRRHRLSRPPSGEAWRSSWIRRDADYRRGSWPTRRACGAWR